MRNPLPLLAAAMLLALLSCSDGQDGVDGQDGANGAPGPNGPIGLTGIAGFKTVGAAVVNIPATATTAPAYFLTITYTPPSTGFALVQLSGSCILRHQNNTTFDDLVVSIYDPDAIPAEDGDDLVVYQSGSRAMLPPAASIGNYFFPVSAQRAIPVTQGVSKTIHAGAQWVINSGTNANCDGRLMLTHHVTQMP